MKYMFLTLMFIISLNAQTVNEKKLNYINKIYPAIKVVYDELNNKFLKIKEDIKNGKNQKEIDFLKIEYKVKTNQELLEAIKPHPISIVMAQGAIESAWLTSRFAQEANNVFGVWSFSNKDKRIEAKNSRGNKKIYLKKYDTLTDSIRDYYKNIGRSWAFKSLREERIKSDNYLNVIPHLKMYSEEREHYVNKLKNVIEYNKFYKFDS